MKSYRDMDLTSPKLITLAKQLRKDLDSAADDSAPPVMFRVGGSDQNTISFDVASREPMNCPDLCEV